MKDVISIVIPIYKVEKYLDKCLNSVINQSYSNIQIICVNDCSPDNSLAIALSFAEKDKRIKVINLEKNVGVDKARFIGIENITGKYTCFIDSDDWVSNNYVEDLYDKANTTDADITYTNVSKVMDKFQLIKTKPKNSYFAINLEKSISNPELFDDYFISFFGVNKLRVSLWGCLYKTQVILKSNCKPSGFKMGEDLVFNLNIFPNISKVSFVENSIYYYRYGGMTATSNPTFLSDIKKQYALKNINIEKYKYFKASEYIKYEYINCFYSHLKNLIILDKNKESDLELFIFNELLDTFYTEDLFRNIKMGEKAQAVREKDVSKIMEIIYRDIGKEKLKHRIKKIVAKLLN